MYYHVLVQEWCGYKVLNSKKIVQELNSNRRVAGHHYVSFGGGSMILPLKVRNSEVGNIFLSAILKVKRRVTL